MKKYKTKEEMIEDYTRNGGHILTNKELDTLWDSGRVKLEEQEPYPGTIEELLNQYFWLRFKIENLTTDTMEKDCQRVGEIISIIKSQK